MDAIKILGELLGNNATGGNLLGSILSGAGKSQTQSQPQSQQSGVADLLRGLFGGASGQQQASSAGGMLESLLGGGQGGGGGNLLGNLLKAAVVKKMAGAGGGSPMDMLSGLLGGAQSESEPEISAPQRQAANEQATILIRAMCCAAKCDGQIDQQEQENILGRLGELDQQEIDFVRQELSSPLDVHAFAREVPREMAPQVYALSIMTVKVDTRQEVAYLRQLAEGLGLDQSTLDAIHQQAGVA